MQLNQAKRWLVSGRVQGVGFRYFVQQKATVLGLNGWTRNLDDGSVEVYATGPAAKLEDLNGLLRRGSRMSDVRGVEVSEAQVLNYKDFRIS